jgi:hypothetical protein
VAPETTPVAENPVMRGGVSVPAPSAARAATPVVCGADIEVLERYSSASEGAERRGVGLRGREAVVVEGDGERLVAQLRAVPGGRRAGGPFEISPPHPRPPGDARIILPGRRGHRGTRTAKVRLPTARTRSKSIKIEISHTERVNRKAYTCASARHRLSFASICAGHIRSPRIQFNVT